MAAATGVKLGAITDSQQGECVTICAATAAQSALQQPDYNEQPTFLVTQSLVSLLTEKGIHCPERPEQEAHGEIQSFQILCLCYGECE